MQKLWQVDDLLSPEGCVQMKYEEYFYQCSPHYLDTIDVSLRQEILGTVEKLPKRDTQRQVNQDFVWLLGSQGWAFDTLPAAFPDLPPQDLTLGNLTKDELRRNNDRQLSHIGYFGCWMDGRFRQTLRHQSCLHRGSIRQSGSHV